jgi:hypothetical protein
VSGNNGTINRCRFSHRNGGTGVLFFTAEALGKEEQRETYYNYPCVFFHSYSSTFSMRDDYNIISGHWQYKMKSWIHHRILEPVV